MDIRYFATNRNPDNLAKRFPREQRVRLWRGGYHFVDMKKYMSYYLGTTKKGDMPKDVVVEQSNDKIFGDNFLKHSKVGSVAICVHGFNVNLHEACTSFGILATSLGNTRAGKGRFVCGPDDMPNNGNQDSKEKLVAIIGFSWPSNGRVVDYVADQRDAKHSGQALANLITRIRCTRRDIRVDLICHSMGNLLACEMLHGLLEGEFRPSEPTDYEEQYPELIPNKLKRAKENDKDGFFVDRLIMLAPDVERRHVTKSVLKASSNDDRGYVGPFHSGLEHLVDDVYNFYSRHDRILDISNWEKAVREKGLGIMGVLDRLTGGLFEFIQRNPDHKWEERLGGTMHPPTAPPNMQSRNAVELTGREIGHGDYIDSRLLAEEIADILLTGI